MASHNEDDSDPFSNGGSGSAGSKRGREELESFSTVIGSKSKPCTKFFSTSGCPFRERCYFLHHVPGRPHQEMTNLGNPSSRNSVGVSGLSDHGVKTRMCNKVNTEKGCRFGDKCRFVHGERELGSSSVHGPEHHSPMGGRLSAAGGRFNHASPGNPSSRNSVGVSGLSDHGVKTRMCNKVNTEEGCRFGDKCRFVHSERELGRSSVHGPEHYSPMGGRLSAGGGRFDHAPPGNPSSRNSVGVSGLSDHGVKTRMCNKVNTEEGCRFGDKCRFAHSETELGRSSVHGPVHYSTMGGRLSAAGGRFDHVLTPGFGASASAKISVDASLAGAIIGIGGITSKTICRVTGARLSIRGHESDPNLKNVELKGTFDQIRDASCMVRGLIINYAPSHSTAGRPRYSTRGATANPANNFKSKLCDNFVKGSCKFGDRCHFAHGAS